MNQIPKVSLPVKIVLCLLAVAYFCDCQLLTPQQVCAWSSSGAVTGIDRLHSGPSHAQPHTAVWRQPRRHLPLLKVPGVAPAPERPSTVPGPPGETGVLPLLPARVAPPSLVFHAMQPDRAPPAFLSTAS